MVRGADRLRVLRQVARLRLVEQLRAGEATPQEVADTLGLTQQNVSKHLQDLTPGVRLKHADVSSHAEPARSSARISSASSRRQAAISGSKACPDRSRTTPTTCAVSPSRRWKAASIATATIRIGNGIASPFARPSGPWPSHGSSRYASSGGTESGLPTRSPSSCATSHPAER